MPISAYPFILTPSRGPRAAAPSLPTFSAPQRRPGSTPAEPPAPPAVRRGAPPADEIPPPPPSIRTGRETREGPPIRHGSAAGRDRPRRRRDTGIAARPRPPPAGL